jgi:hypothetical protein
MDSRGLFKDEATFEIIEQQNLEVDFRAEVGKLPYFFRDPIKFDKKVDPRKFKFGSKIDGKEGETPNLVNRHLIKSGLVGIDPLMKSFDKDEI